MDHTECLVVAASLEREGAVGPLASLSDDALLRGLQVLVGRSRSTEAALLHHLAEVDARRLYAREACPSMFVYCTRVLRFSEAEAYLRITAARRAREHPALLEALADGRLHLCTLARLAPHLTGDNVDSLVARAAGRSKREVMELVAELAPRPDVPAAIRALPSASIGACSRRESAASEEDAPADGLIGAGHAFAGHSKADGEPSLAGKTSAGADAPGLCPDRVTNASASGATPTPPLSHPPVAGRPAEPPAAAVVPLAPGRYRVQFTADRELRDKLERLRDLLGLAERDLARVIDAAVTEKLLRLEARRFAQAAVPRRSLAEADTRARNRHLPAAVRRAVFRRDGGQCRFVDHQGRRCPVRSGLEFHHRYPYACGGDHAVDNLQLLCRAHNRYVAEVDFGRALPASLVIPSGEHGRTTAADGVRPLTKSEQRRRPCREAD